MYNNNSIAGKWISRIYRGFITFIKTSITQPGIGYGQISILKYLQVEEGISQDQLSRKIGIDRTTLNRTIKPLIKHGYLKQDPNPNDKRANVITFTLKGRQTMPEVQKILDKWNTTLLHGFSEEEKKQFLNGLKRAAENAHNFNSGRT